jgi:hypothetical protein
LEAWYSQDVEEVKLADEAGVYGGTSGFGDGDASCVRVKRVEQVVKGTGEDG